MHGQRNIKKNYNPVYNRRITLILEYKSTTMCFGYCPLPSSGCSSS